MGSARAAADKESPMRRLSSTCVGLVAAAATVIGAPAARADNKRLNDSVLANVYTFQHQAGCTNDVLNDNQLDGDLGSDSSTPQSRAAAAGYHGRVAQTVAINGIEILNQWFNDPVALATMRDCSFTQMGVWSANSLGRSVVVAVYGQSL
jgi:hypothetical protein